MRKVLRVVAIVAAFALTAWIGVVALAQSSGTSSPSHIAVDHHRHDDGDSDDLAFTGWGRRREGQL